jgi:Homocysteine/selenocysteine methylase (S-methylmethionine-dependent)
MTLPTSLVLDGGLATQLEAQGEDLSSSLWSAAVLRSDPEAITRAHAAFFAAGAQVATTATYQLTPIRPSSRSGFDEAELASPHPRRRGGGTVSTRRPRLGVDRRVRRPLWREPGQRLGVHG